MVCSEFDLVDHYFNRMHSKRLDVVMGVGDDCALLSMVNKKWIAISTDTLVAGTHFFPDIDPSDLGYKSLAVNLSDIAAMGADPAWLLLAITLPSVEKNWLIAFSDSLFQQLDYYDMQLIGGDTTRGPLSLTMTIQGIIPSGRALTRHGAHIGDWIYVTGTLGDSAAGLAILQNRFQVEDPKDKQYLLACHLRPEPRIIQGQAIRELASAATDISDGMIMDLKNLLTQSNCGAYINLDDIPYSSALLRHATPDQAMSWALSGGEDYELCFTVPENNLSMLNTVLDHTGISFTCIGRVLSQNEGIQLVHHRQLLNYNFCGYDHFKQVDIV